MRIFSGKVLGVIAVVVVAGIVSAVFYFRQPAYLAAFALFGLLVGAYVVLMARVFGTKAGLKTMLASWIAVLVAMSAGEIYLRATPDAEAGPSPGLLPTVVAKFMRWKTSDVAELWVAADFGMRIQDPATLSDMTDIMTDQTCNAYGYRTIQTVSGGYIPTISLKLDDVLNGPYTEESLQNGKDEMLLRQKIADAELQNLKQALSAGQDTLARTQEPDKAALLHRFTDMQNAMISAYQARNDIWAPAFSAIQAMLDELLKVKSAGRITDDDRVLWSSLTKKYQDVVAQEHRSAMPNFNVLQTGYNKTLRQLLGMRPDDARAIPVQPRVCAYPINWSGTQAATPRALSDDVDKINATWAKRATL